MGLLAITLGYTLQFFEHVRALATNATIDDQYGDSLTGVLPSYYPNAWNQGNQCAGCFAKPSPVRAFDGSERAFSSSDRIDLTVSKHGTIPQSKPQVP